MGLLKIIPLIIILSSTECKESKEAQIVKENDFDGSIVFQSNTSLLETELLKIEELPGSVRKIYREWDSLSHAARKKLFDEIFQRENYWGYFFSAWAKYSFYTENPKVHRIFKESLRFVKNEYAKDGIIITQRELEEGHWYRETFARNMRLLLEAFTYTNDLDVLNVVDEQTSLWIRTNKKSLMNGFEIYPYSSKLKNERSSEINPNQNLQMGLVFSKLYFNSYSKFYLDEFIKESAINEVNAGLSLVKNDGFFPLNQHSILVGDSNYAGLSTTILYELVQIWGNHEWIEILKKVGAWIEKSFNENRPWNTKADGKDYHFDQFSAFNLFSRIPSFYAAGIPSKRAREWMEFTKNRFPDFQILGLTPRWDILQSLPESYYSNKERSKNLKIISPQIYVRKDSNTVYITVVGTEIIKFELGNLKLVPVKDVVFQGVEIFEGNQVKVSDIYDNNSIFVFASPLSGESLNLVIDFFDYNNPIKDK